MRACRWPRLLQWPHRPLQRYTIAIDASEIRCIEDYSVFIVDYFNTELERGAIYAFSAEGLEPFFDDGQPLAKYLVGMPGDAIEITSDQRVLINDVEVADTLASAHHLDMTPSDFVGKGVIGEGEYWFMGDTPESFDSRYWGSVGRDQILGRAHGIF